MEGSMLCRYFHAQFNMEFLYDTIDMDFMNENQSAHGDREFGHMVARMGIERKVIMSYWNDADVVKCLAAWMCTAVGIMEFSHIHLESLKFLFCIWAIRVHRLRHCIRLNCWPKCCMPENYGILKFIFLM